MNDLSGLDWTLSSYETTATSKPSLNSSSQYPSLRPVPSPALSGRSTPLFVQPPPKPPTPANDSFANLVSSGSTKASANLSLQERHKQLLEERARQEAARKRQYDQQYGRESHFWDTLGRDKSTLELHRPPLSSVSSAPVNRLATTGTATQSSRLSHVSADDDDVLAAFDAATAVNRSSHFPPPNDQSWGPTKAAAARNGAPGKATTSTYDDLNLRAASSEHHAEDDDDPFGLGQLAQKQTVAASHKPAAEDDDILGALGKPVLVQSPVVVQKELGKGLDADPGMSRSASVISQDKAVAELVDMGFAVDKSKRALEHTENGVDVQAAIGILLDQAHDEARRNRGERRSGERRMSPRRNGMTLEAEDAARPTRGERSNDMAPAWMRQRDSRSKSGQSRQDSRSPALLENDVTKLASELGTTLFKSANSLWKTGQKQVQKVVAELQQDGDASQPKWMRETQTEGSDSYRASRPSAIQRGRPVDDPPGTKTNTTHEHKNLTDEAMLLEPDVLKRPQRPSRLAQGKDQASTTSSAPPDVHRIAMNAKEIPQRRRDQGAIGRLNRQDVEEQSSQMYVSPARRKIPAKPVAVESARELDLFSAPTSSNRPSQKQESSSSRPMTQKPVSKPLAPLDIRPSAPRREIPHLSSADLYRSNRHRQAGNEAFRRGDYDSAHKEYTSALQPLPSSHPLAVVLLVNRALTRIRTGDARAAVADTDEAITVIGPSHGEGETIKLGSGEGEKSMKELYGKALMRKAEALELLEKWTEAAAVWRTAVETGVGGSVSIQGRDRCERAAAPKPAALSAVISSASARKSTPTVAKKPNSRPSALSDLAGRSAEAGYDAEAVKRLRAANAAAEKADDEKFALADIVEAKINAWKGSKSDNLRALLGSLDTVLWPEAGWKKVGMNELVMPARVKVVYMKAIAKVHPDKIPQTATTEQRMISASVFSTLNEAWDKFRRDNGL